MNGARAAAAQLLELYAAPLNHRPRLTHGREAFPGAIHALRFAQGRFPEEVLRKSSDADLGQLREAAVFFIRQVCLWDGASHYQVLGVSRDASRQVIKEHYHALMGLFHPDRKVADPERWPAAAASRVNKAYAVLSNDALRRKYDAGLGDSANAFPNPGAGQTATAPPHAAVRRPGALPRSRYVRGALIGTAAVAGLFFFNTWWLENTPAEYATLRSATPLEASWRWMRESMISGSVPRFIGAGERPASGLPSGDEPVVARKSAAGPSLIPVSHAQTVAPAEAERAPPAKVPEPTAVAQLAPSPREAAGTAVRVETPRPQPKAAPAQVQRPSAADEAGIAELELLVAHLVSHYETGDVDRLVGLFDTASVSAQEAVGLRRDFEKFFGATSARQLALRTISWESTSRPARARGEAYLQATYGDRPERMERVVAVDLGIVWRDGTPRLSRLTMFPHE